jgi:hypothetical protein
LTTDEKHACGNENDIESAGELFAYRHGLALLKSLWTPGWPPKIEITTLTSPHRNPFRVDLTPPQPVFEARPAVAVTYTAHHLARLR